MPAVPRCAVLGCLRVSGEVTADEPGDLRGVVHGRTGRMIRLRSVSISCPREETHAKSRASISWSSTRGRSVSTRSVHPPPQEPTAGVARSRSRAVTSMTRRRVRWLVAKACRIGVVKCSQASRFTSNARSKLGRLAAFPVSGVLVGVTRRVANLRHPQPPVRSASSAVRDAAGHRPPIEKDGARRDRAWLRASCAYRKGWLHAHRCDLRYKRIHVASSQSQRRRAREE